MEKKENLSETGTAPEKNWTKGSIVGNLLLLSWPIVIMESLFMIGQVVDMVWVGKLGPSSIAGVGLANICVLLLMSMDVGLVVGVRAVISRFTGSGDMRGASNTAGQAVVLGALWGIMVALVGVMVAKPVFGLFGVEPEVITEGATYLRIISIGWIAMGIMVMGLYTIQATGDTLKPMLIEICARTVHMALCPFLVLGLWIFPGMGVAGAAISSVIGHSLGAIIVLWLLLNKRTRLHVSLEDFRPVPVMIWRILKIGIPALVLHAQKSLGDLILAGIIVPFGTIAVAAHSLVIRVEMIFIALSLGIGGGSGVLVGQNLGAGQPDRAEKSGWMAVSIIETITVALSIFLLVQAETVVGIFTVEPELVELGAIFLRIATAGFILLGLVFVLQDSIAGSGDTMPTMIMSIAMIWVIQLPLALLLPRIGDLGVYGVRWAIVAATFVGASFYILYFVHGRWKSKRI